MLDEAIEYLKKLKHQVQVKLLEVIDGYAIIRVWFTRILFGCR